MHDQELFQRIVGRNVQRFRKRTSSSQSGLAEDLADRGLSFQQQTIQKIEKGTRPLRLDEAVVIAEALRVSVADLFTIPDGDVPDDFITQLLDLRTRERRLAHEIIRLQDQQAQVAMELTSLHDRHTETLAELHRLEDLKEQIDSEVLEVLGVEDHVPVLAAKRRQQSDRG